MTEPSMPHEVTEGTVWFVDDEATTVSAFESYFKLAGFRTRGFVDARTALEELKRVPAVDFDGVLVVDLRMPGMNGSEFIDHVRAMDRTMAIIVLTAFGSHELLEKALGDIAHIVHKPPNADENLRSETSLVRVYNMKPIDLAALADCVRLSCNLRSKALARRSHDEQTNDIGNDSENHLTPESVISMKRKRKQFDVFLSYNSEDEPAVEEIAKELLAVGLLPWFAKWDLAPSETIQGELAKAIKGIPCGALCVGPKGVGNWQLLEIREYIGAWTCGQARIIPVIMRGVENKPVLPFALDHVNCVDMRHWQEEGNDAFYRLVCGILERAPGGTPILRPTVRDVVAWQGFRME